MDDDLPVKSFFYNTHALHNTDKALFNNEDFNLVARINILV
jgi:hypothetical protein